ncbi:MAG: transglycosylase SLT domain-containing protein, partial [Gemmatimonadetes bacterium]|nr:transglycosylase SLT domain-containing protein [Gemmatimonadota bacterium]
GALALAAADTAAARQASLDALASGPRTPAGGRAADRLLRVGGLDAATAAGAAEALSRTGERARALEAYDLHARLVGGVEAMAPEARLARARLLAATDRRQDEAVTEFRALSTHEDERVGAVALDQWARLRRSQGRTGDEATLRGWLLERYPTSPEAADVVFFRGDAAHDRNEYPEALRQYEALVDMAPSQSRAGLARMRAGMIHILHDRPREAVDVFEGYLRDFPDGRRWEEAAYWAAHGRLLLGDSAAARDHLARIREENPFSYYAVRGAERVGEAFSLDLPAGPEPIMAPWVGEGLRRLDLLDAAGLEEGSAAEVERLVARSRGDRDAMLRLAEELVVRGHTIPGINLVWELRSDGEPWTLRLARAAYPFPFREAVLREAEEWGADPWWVVAIIRQESAFDPDIRSSAGAVGLMQVMPETGRQVARAVGPESFRPEALEEPDVNLHLGTHYFVENLQRFGGVVPLVLSAYNAGPHRADAWRRFPEARDWLEFTERIPFGETRDYVKQVTRNRALYQELWRDVPRRDVSF